MKTQHIKVTTRPANKIPGMLAAFVTALLALSVLTKAWSQELFWKGNADNPAVAGSGTWAIPQPSPPPISWSSTPGTLNTPADWVDGSLAHFQGSVGGTATLFSNITAAGISFDSGANAFTIETNGNVLTILGVGLVNNSGKAQTIINNGEGFETSNGSTVFLSASTAGGATITNEGGTGISDGIPFIGGSTTFQNTSTAGGATINNNAGTNGGLGGLTVFLNTSTAGNAVITNNGATVTGAVGGGTVFLNASNAGSARITNNGGTVAGAFGGVTVFGGIPDVTGRLIPSGADTSSAGSATIINNGGTGGGFGGTTEFLASTDGGTARAITNGNGNFDISRLTTPGMKIGSIEGSGNYFLGSKTLTVGGNNLSTTVSGVIQDGGFLPGFFGDGGTGGSLTKVGTGTLTLTGANTYSGTTTVNGGSLIVDGSIASVRALVNADGLLGGRGLIGGNVVNSGIVSPGDSPGTMTVSGNYTQSPNGTLRIEVAGLGQGQFDVLAVGGHASLAGTLQLIRLGPFQLLVGDKLTFLTAKGGVSGTFSTVQNPFISNTIVKADVVYLSDAVQLVGTQGSFTEAACNPNSLAVAKALDSAVGDPRAAALISFLNTQPLNQLCGDFELIAPEELTSMYNIGFSVENVQTDNLNRRMNNVRAGSTGFSSAGFTMNGVTPTYGNGLAGPTGTEGKTGPSVLAPVPENRWGVFATGLGEFTRVDSTDGASGFDLQTGGVTVGVDYRIGSNFAVGLLAGYAHTNADLVNNGNLEVNSAKFGLYATAFSGGFYLNSAVTGGWSEYDSHRTALLGTANGSTDGGDINVLVSGGYDWRTGNLSIGPTASFQYDYLSFNGFTESGSLAPLKFNDQHSDSIRTAFGMKATYDWKVGNVLVRPELRAAWQHEYGLSAYPIVASFADGAGSSFTVSGPKIGRDSLLLGAGAAILWNDRIATYIYYDGELGRTNFDSHNISGGIRVTF